MLMQNLEGGGGELNKVHYDWRENIEFEKTSLL